MGQLPLRQKTNEAGTPRVLSFAGIMINDIWEPAQKINVQTRLLFYYWGAPQPEVGGYM